MAAGARADLLRWCGSVHARDRREPPPTPELWNHAKLEKDVALARELHLAGGRVQKSTLRAAPDATFDLPGDKEEVLLHLVAYALDAAAEEEARRLTATMGGEGGDGDGEDSDATQTQTQQRTASKILPPGTTPFMSTRSDVASGRGIPARILIDDEAQAQRDDLAATEMELYSGAKKTGTSSSASSSSAAAAAAAAFVIQPGDAVVRGLELAIGTMRVGERALVRVAPEYAYLHPTAAKRGQGVRRPHPRPLLLTPPP